MFRAFGGGKFGSLTSAEGFLTRRVISAEKPQPTRKRLEMPRRGKHGRKKIYEKRRQTDGPGGAGRNERKGKEIGGNNKAYGEWK